MLSLSMGNSHGSVITVTRALTCTSQTQLLQTVIRVIDITEGKKSKVFSGTTAERMTTVTPPKTSARHQVKLGGCRYRSNVSRCASVYSPDFAGTQFTYPLKDGQLGTLTWQGGVVASKRYPANIF